MSDFYLLGEQKAPYPVPNIEEWAKGMANQSRKVERTPLGKHGFVSTVFLGIDHGFSLEAHGDPVLFETMVFLGDWREQFSRRYSFWPEAVQGHAEVLKEALKYMRENGSRNQREGRYLDRLKRKRG